MTKRTISEKLSPIHIWYLVVLGFFFMIFVYIPLMVGCRHSRKVEMEQQQQQQQQASESSTASIPGIPPVTLSWYRERLVELLRQVDQGCGNHGCQLHPVKGQGTNGSCECSPHRIARDLRNIAEALERLGHGPWPDSEH
jgi:heme/copper-type cytochrome/quinol oxidase subunit 2